MSDSMRKILWIVTEVFYPDQTTTSYILSKIADKMTEKYDVKVITTDGLYEKGMEGNPFYTISQNIDIVRVTFKDLDKNNLVQRFYRMTGLTKLLFSELKKRIRKGDKLLIPTNPALLLLKCSKLKKNMDIEYTILVHDVFPENTIPAGIIQNENSLILKYLSIIFNKAYSNADRLIVLGRDMHEVVFRKLEKNSKTQVITIENWGDVHNIKPDKKETPDLQSRHSEGKITIQYAGNIGRVQGLDVFIDLLMKSGNQNLCFDLYGEGAMKSKLQEIVDRNMLQEQVHFYKNYSREDQNKILNNTDIALITLAEGMYGLGVPSKTYNILASGKPILFLGDRKSEIGCLTTEESVGYVFDINQHEKIIDFLRNLSIERLTELSDMGRKSRLLAETKYSENIILEKFSQVI